MRDLEAERIFGMVCEAVDGLRSLRAERYVSKTARAAVVVNAPTWNPETAAFLQRAMDAFHCNAQVYWRGEARP